MKKKTFLIALFTVVCTLSYADDEVEVTVDGLRYSCDLVAQTAKVIRGDDYTGLTKVNIPSTVMCQEKECTVTEIGESAFSECEKIRDLTLPATLKIIRQSAFQGCQKIYKLQLPEGLEVIESQVFYGCSMPEVIIPEGVTSIGFWAFNSNTFLKRVELPSTLTYLEDHVFDMTKLTTVISHITEPFELSEDAFMGTKAFLFVPEGLRGAYLATEGWNAFPNIFEGERGEATVNGLDFVYGTLSDIAVLVKGDYSEMEKIDIPASFTVDEKEYTVTEIQDEAFAWCKFNEAVIPEGVEKIGEKVFSECQNLVKVALPSTLKKIGTGAIDFNLSNPTPTIVSHMKEPCTVEPHDIGVLMTYDYVAQKDIYAGMEYNYTSPYLYIPEGCREAYEAAGAWTGCSLIFEGDPIDVEYDGMNYVCATGSKEAMLVKGSYDGNEDFKDIVVPEIITVGDVEYTVTVIGEEALSYLYHVESISIPQTVYAVCRSAFEYSRPVQQFTMPKSLRIIACKAFLSFEGFKNEYEPIMVPEGVEAIGSMAFNLHAQTVSLPSTLKRLWNDSFDYGYGGDVKYIICRMQEPCMLLGSYYEVPFNKILYVPKGCAENYLAASGWRGAQSVYEGEIGVSNVDGLNYRWDTATNTAWLIKGDYEELESVTIPDYIAVGREKCVVTTICHDAFYFCHNLQHVAFPSTLKKIESSAFWECTNLSELELPRGLEEIESSVFCNCRKLTKLILPRGLRTIGIYAFQRCENVEVIELPAKLEEIGSGAFAGIDMLARVNSHIKYPFPVESSAFEYVAGRFTDAELHVPVGTKQDYKDMPYWDEFKTIIDDLSEELGDVNEDYEVDARDLMLLVRYISGDLTLKVKLHDDDIDYDFNLHEADMNGDDVIDIADIVALANKIIGK